MTLTTKFLGRTYTSPLMNGAGVRCTTVEELEALRQSSAGSFVTKTATREPRAGNPGHRMSLCRTVVSIPWVCRTRGCRTIWTI